MKEGDGLNELDVFSEKQLPDTLEDLTQFVLVGKAKLNAYMIKLQTVNKLSVAQEIRDQTLKETQEISTALIAAEQRIGELLLAIPKQAGASNFSRDEEKLKTKGETIKEMGYGKNEASDYQQMAKNPDVVQKVIEDALANGEIVTKTQVLKEIKAERDRAKAELEERDRKIKDLERDSKEREDYIEELENREPEVKTVTKEVIPDDYKELKRQLETAKHDLDVYDADLKKAREKADASAKKVKELESQIGSDKSRSDAARDIQSFTDYTNDYIRRYGGHVWAFDKYADLPEPVKNDFVKSLKALDGFAQQMIANLEGVTGIK